MNRGLEAPVCTSMGNTDVHLNIHVDMVKIGELKFSIPSHSPDLSASQQVQ